MQEQKTGVRSGHARSAGGQPASPDKAVERTEQIDTMTTQEVEDRLKQMLDRGEIGMSQYNLARQDILKYGAKFEDMPYLFVGKELPLDLTKESRKWYNLRLPKEEAVKLLKKPGITAGKMKAIREHHSMLPEEETMLKALEEMDDQTFARYLEDYEARSNPLEISRRMDKIEKTVEKMGRTVDEVGANVGEMKRTVELLKTMFQRRKEREEDGSDQKYASEHLNSGNGNVGPVNTKGKSSAEDKKNEYEDAGKDIENGKNRKNNGDGNNNRDGLSENKSAVDMTDVEERQENRQIADGNSTVVKRADAETGEIIFKGAMVESNLEKVSHVKIPSFFEKLLPGFYHPVKKEYIQLKQRERERRDYLTEMKRMADDLYEQNFMDEETYFIFCELAFKEQVLDKETADVLIDGIKRGVPFALLFKVVRNVKNSADWEASVNLLESLMNYQRQNDERAQAALKR